jgi:hypothetical protein
MLSDKELIEISYNIVKRAKEMGIFADYFNKIGRRGGEPLGIIIGENNNLVLFPTIKPNDEDEEVEGFSPSFLFYSFFNKIDKEGNLNDFSFYLRRLLQRVHNAILVFPFCNVSNERAIVGVMLIKPKTFNYLLRSYIIYGVIKNGLVKKLHDYYIFYDDSKEGLTSDLVKSRIKNDLSKKMLIHL